MYTTSDLIDEVSNLLTESDMSMSAVEINDDIEDETEKDSFIRFVRNKDGSVFMVRFTYIKEDDAWEEDWYILNNFN